MKTVTVNNKQIMVKTVGGVVSMLTMRGQQREFANDATVTEMMEDAFMSSSSWVVRGVEDDSKTGA